MLWHFENKMNTALNLTMVPVCLYYLRNSSRASDKESDYEKGNLRLIWLVSIVHILLLNNSYISKIKKKLSHNAINENISLNSLS